MNVISRAKSLVKYILPYGIVEYLRYQRERKIEEEIKQQLKEEINQKTAKRKAKIDVVKNILEESKENIIIDQDNNISYNAIFSYLVDRGIPEIQIREGSVPEKSLKFLVSVMDEFVDFDTPNIIGLHIGNFVGVSLAYLTAFMVKKNPNALMISIDPNVPHRGVINPQSHAASLLTACGLQKNSLIILGYSNQKCISNDGFIFEGYDPEKNVLNEAGCEEVISSFKRIIYSHFSFVFIDGNHEYEYLINEIRSVLPVLKLNGLVILDDVDEESWPEIKKIFNNIQDLGIDYIASDGRIGIARFTKNITNP